MSPRPEDPLFRELAGDVTPEHAALINRAADILRLFLATRPAAEAEVVRKGIKGLFLNGVPQGSGWFLGVRPATDSESFAARQVRDGGMG